MIQVTNKEAICQNLARSNASSVLRLRKEVKQVKALEPIALTME